MENDKNILMEKVMHLAMLLRRLSAPRFGNEGPRGRSQERALTQIALRDGISQACRRSRRPGIGARGKCGNGGY